STEWLANILFPAFVASLLAGPRWVAITVGVFSAFAISTLAWQNGGSLDLSLANTWAPIIRCFAEFAIGMLIHRWRDVGLASDVAGSTLLALLILAIFVKFP